MDKFVKWQKEDEPQKNRLPFLLLAALIFPTGIPALLALVMPRLDQALGISSFYAGTLNTLLGVVGVVAGGVTALWTIAMQFTQASGTPMPMLPTKKLLVSGPFKYCRNPMTLGTVLAYGGIAVWVGSLSALALVVIFATALIC